MFAIVKIFTVVLQYLHFIERVCAALQMEPLTSDVSLDYAGDAIISRLHQIMRHEPHDLVDSQSHVYHLQNKIRTLKEQIESRDTHLELLRRKVAALEERLAERSDVDSHDSDEYHKNRKLLKLVEKLKTELHEVERENEHLKTRLYAQAGSRVSTISVTKITEKCVFFILIAVKC